MRMTEKKKITLECAVDSYRSGWTVVEFLAHRFKYHTPERWAKRVTDRWVQVNGANVEPEHVVNKEDVISYTIWHAEPEVDFRFDVVYEDDHILAVSKSGNIPVHACGVYIQSTLIATLKNIYGNHLNLAHRLDRASAIQPQRMVLRLAQPGDQACAARPAQQIIHISHVHASRVDSYQSFAVAWDRLLDLFESENIR